MNQVNVAIYSYYGFELRTMQLIRKCLNAGINIGDYIDCTFSHDQIYEIAKGLIDGIDVGEYNDNPAYSAEKMRFIRLQIKKYGYYYTNTVHLFDYDYEY